MYEGFDIKGLLPSFPYLNLGNFLKNWIFELCLSTAVILNLHNAKVHL